ncbi:pectin esterase [Sphingobacterium sp. N143]|mgnify:CR=1 FL=1|uniref:pectinesterase family protein n=1 Tax=Sphingobacterium sp. N143 TaxID=2746727 RepID=UPI002576EA2F|nr:pectinesterase family protein [Sphingobacterium sp. N143]MDM1293898.1 pectin esterase [Sphingobacterium sp. N143]
MRAIILSFCLLPFFLFASTVKSYDFVVAKDGSGDFRTIQAAINAVPDFRKKETKIYIKNGIYQEKIILPGSKQHVTLIGEDKFSTILRYDDYAQKKNSFGEEKGTSGSASFYGYGDDFTAINLAFENSSGPVGQAVAAWIAGDRSLFINCRFLGFQDTLYTYGKGTRQLYYQCYIEGTVDYIFGSATAWFEDCQLHCKDNGYITAASTPKHNEFGYIFNRCQIIGDKKTKIFYLGRPWRPHAKVIFMQCNLPAFIAAEGWHNWGKQPNETTAYFAEYKNTGPGSLSQNRVKWSHQLTDQEADILNFQRVFNDWTPNLSLDR